MDEVRVRGSESIVGHRAREPNPSCVVLRASRRSRGVGEERSSKARWMGMLFPNASVLGTWASGRCELRWMCELEDNSQSNRLIGTLDW